MPTEPFTREQQIDENSRGVAEARRRLSDHRLDIDNNTGQILNLNDEIRENRNCLEEQRRNIDCNTRRITEQGREIEGAKNVTKNNTMAIQEIRKETYPVILDNRKEFNELKHKVDDLAQQGAPCALDTLKDRRKIEDIESRVRDLEQQDARGYKKLLDGLHNRVKALEQQQAREYRREIEELQNRVIALEQQQTSYSELQNRVTALEQQQTGSTNMQSLQKQMTALEQQINFTRGYKESGEDLQNMIMPVEHKQADLDSFHPNNIGDDPSENRNNGEGVDESFIGHNSDSNCDDTEELQAGVAVAVKQDIGESKDTNQINRNIVKNNPDLFHDEDKKKDKQKDFEDYNQKDFSHITSEIRNKHCIERKMDEQRSLERVDELVEKQDIEDTKSDLNGTHIDSTGVCVRETEKCYSKDKNSGQYCDRNENTGDLPGKFKVHYAQEDETRSTCYTEAQKDKNSNTCENAEHQPLRKLVGELENRIKILEMQVEELKNGAKVQEQQTGKSKIQNKRSLPDIASGSKKYMEEGRNLEAVSEQSKGEYSNRPETERRRALE